jgi:hypothetical protein
MKPQSPKLIPNPTKIDYTKVDHSCEWIPLIGKEEGNKIIPTFLFTCLKCGNLKVGRHTIRISRHRMDMDDKPIKNLGAPVDTTDAIRQSEMDVYFGNNINAQTGTTYTLVLSDVGQLIQCTNASAITLTVPPNSSVAFPIGTEISVLQNGAGAVTITEGSGVTINSKDSNTKINGQYKLVELKKIATNTWVLTGNLIKQNPLIEYLIVAGGGGGGSFGGGGGAGGFLTNTTSILEVSTNYTVTVGAGGAGDTDVSGTGANGSNSVFNSFTSLGGGGGGSRGPSADFLGTDGAAGGSGGGASAYSSGDQPVGGVGSQGYNGGASIIDVEAYTWGSGGAGGAGAVGVDGIDYTGGNGGVGLQNSITGSAVYYAGGGGGSTYTGTRGTGGNGGGGNGGSTTPDLATTAGTANTGGGGGGGKYVSTGGAGGSGIVILRYPNTYTITVGGSLTSSTATDGDYKVTSFTAGSDDISFS